MMKYYKHRAKEIANQGTQEVYREHQRKQQQQQQKKKKKKPKEQPRWDYQKNNSLPYQEPNQSTNSIRDIVSPPI